MAWGGSVAKRRILCLQSENPDMGRFDNAANYLSCDDCGGVVFAIFFHGGAVEFNCQGCHGEMVFLNSVALVMFDIMSKGSQNGSNGTNGTAHA